MSRPLALVGVTVLAAVVRFATLDAQSYWYDEALTVQLVELPFGDMLDGVMQGQAQPPLYFILAWLWEKVFGAGEIGLRSLSALLGPLTVPVAYLAAARFGGPRVALATGLLTAVAPPLVWYSQEARAYALVTLLAALALLFFLRALDTGNARDLWIWVAVSLAAVVSHYFALFLIAPMAAWLLLRGPERRRIVPPLLGLGAGLLAIAPMLLYQQNYGGANWIGEVPLRPRVRDVGLFFVAGPTRFGPIPDGLAFVAFVAAFALACAAALRWSEPRVRGRVVAMLAIAGGVLVLPFVAALVGSDYILDRNFLPAWLPLTIVVAVALCVAPLGRLGPAGVGGIALVFAVVVVAVVPVDVDRQRDDWRGVAEHLGPPRQDRVLAVSPFWHGATLLLYERGLQRMDRPRPVRTVATVELGGFIAWNAPAAAAPPPPPFRRTRVTRVQRLTVTEYTAPRPTMVDPAALRTRGPNRAEPMFQPAS